MHRKLPIKDAVTGERKEIDHFKTIGHCGNLAGAVKCIIEDMTRRKLKKEAKTLEDAVRVIKNTNSQFYELLEKTLTISGGDSKEDIHE